MFWIVTAVTGAVPGPGVRHEPFWSVPHWVNARHVHRVRQDSPSTTEVSVRESMRGETAQPGSPAEHDPNSIELRLAARLEHLPIIRSVAANLAIRADFDLDSIADLKLA